MMKWRTIIRFFVIPAIAIVITLKITNFTVSWLGLDKSQPGKVKSSGEAAIGGSFSLINQDGKPVSDTDFRGKLMLVYFGFTHCPDICPTDLMLISDVMEKLGDDAKKIQPLFITIDPKRDNPAELKTYLSNFNPAIVGLTGTKEQINAVTGIYRIYSKEVQAKDTGGYLMDHSAFIYFMGKDGKYITHFNGKQDADEIVAGVKGRL